MAAAQYTNTGVVAASPGQFENNTANNTASVVVLPKGLKITKSADTSALSDPIAAGDQITYTVTAENPGLLGLTNVTVADSIIADADMSLISGDTNNDGILGANEIWQWQGTYQVQQSDIDTNGGGDADIDNTVTVSTNELPAVSDSVAVPVSQRPALTVTKAVDQPSVAIPSTLTYTIAVTNTGNQTLTGITPTDTLPDGTTATLTGPAGDTGQPAQLSPGESWEFTTSYTATQTDIDSGNALINSVTVTALETGSAARTATAETLIVSKPGFTVTKAVDSPSLSAPATLNYTIAVENTGNLSLTGVTVTDYLPDGTDVTPAGPVADSATAGVLDVAETWIYNISYPVDQNTIDSAVDLVNRVEVVSNETGTTPQSDSATTEIVTTPAFTVAKTVDRTSVSTPGLLSYRIEITNTGNVTLSDVAMTDQYSNGSVIELNGPSSDTGVAGVLDVGESWNYTSSYQVTQADIDTTADLTNTISVNPAEADPQTASATTVVSSAPEIRVTKTADQATLSAPATVSYVIDVINTGNTSLTGVTPVDTLPDGTTAVLVGPLNDSGAIGTLDVAETWQYTTTYSVGQSDIDAGSPKNNTVTVTSEQTGTDLYTASATTTITSTPGFSVEKTVEQQTISEPQLLSYRITISNTGNITLTDVVVSDQLPDGTTTLLTGPTGDVGIASALDVGETWTYNTGYSASLADIVAGTALVNSVTVDTAEAGTLSDSAETGISQQPAIKIVKTAVEEGFTIAGDIINYAFLVSNTGNLPLTEVTISDPLADRGSLRCLPPGQPVSAQLSTGPFTLEPGDQMNCTAIRTVVDADIAATKIDNLASVSSIDPGGQSIGADSGVITVQMITTPPVATADHVSSEISAVPVTLPGGTNDSDINNDKDDTTVSLIHPDALDTDGDGDFDSLTVANVGSWIADNNTGTVTFTPEVGYTDDPAPVSYTISDRSGQVSNAAGLSINYPQTAPLAKADVKVNPAVPSPENPTTVNVLADNGEGADTDPENDLDARTVTFTDARSTYTDGDGDTDNLIVAGEGYWQIDNETGGVTFTPLSGFFSDPTPVFYTISDTTGLVSNQASITVDYPQTAPLAVDDEALNQPLAQPVVVAVLSNDSDPEENLDPVTVTLVDPQTDASVTVLPVAGEGVWRVSLVTGNITFTPDAGYLRNPTPVEYTVFDSTNAESNRATVTITYESPASITGTAWLDHNKDGQVNSDETRKTDWTLNLLDSDGRVVAITTTDENGEYEFLDLIPGEYTIEFYNVNGVFMDSVQTTGPVVAGQTVLLPLPVDPSGVVYDSIERSAVEGVTLHLVNATGTVIDATCLRDNQQGQVTAADGLYAFDVIPGAHSTCASADVYRLEIVSAPAAYHPDFSAIIRPVGAAGCGSAAIGCAVSGTFDSNNNESLCTVDALSNTNACEIQPQPDAPQVGDDTRYFIEFALESGDQNVIFNHLPIDARANDAEILLTKSTSQRSTSVGGLLKYTITAENLKQAPALDIEIIDTPPAGFSYVPNTVLLTRTGADLELGTADDVITPLDAAITNTMTLGQIDLAPEESIRISYMMRVGTGVVRGYYTNRVKASGPNGEASNEAVAGVELVADTVLSQATLTGKVFWDRDKDGIQDPATATQVTIQSPYYVTLKLPDLPARGSINDDPASTAVVVNMPATNDNRFEISTREGTRIEIDNNGSVTERHIGDRARGINAQDIKVCTRHTIGIPTLADSTTGTDPVDIIEITLSNLGIGETGIPGARLATASGLLIAADGYGRFSIPDVDAGNTANGRNFILKVDPASLPANALFTTENPYVLRIDNRALNRMNFGVFLPEPMDQYAHGCEPHTAAARQAVEVKLGSIFFDTDDASIRDDQRGVVADIIDALREYGGGVITISAHTDNRASAQYNTILAHQRADTVRDILARALGKKLMSRIRVEIDPAANPEADR